MLRPLMLVPAMLFGLASPSVGQEMMSAQNAMQVAKSTVEAYLNAHRNNSSQGLSSVLASDGIRISPNGVQNLRTDSSNAAAAANDWKLESYEVERAVPVAPNVMLVAARWSGSCGSAREAGFSQLTLVRESNAWKVRSEVYNHTSSRRQSANETPATTNCG